MSLRLTSTVSLALLCSLGAATAVNAATYQIEGKGIYGATTIEFDQGGDFDLDNLGFEGTYYLMPVDAATGPLRERSFIDKSAFLKADYAVLKPDEGEDTTDMGLEARFVTTSDLIFELSYSQRDFGPERVEDVDTIGIGVGTYLDGRTTIVANLAQIEAGDFESKILVGQYRKLIDLANPGTYLAYGVQLGYIDAEEENGNLVGVNGRYYPSEIMSAGLGFARTSIDDQDQTTISFEAEYFISESLFAGLDYLIETDSDDNETTTYLLNIGARF